MKARIQKKSLAKAVSTTLVTSALGIAANVNASENPFQINNLPSGYMVADEKVKGQMPPDTDVEREGSVGDDKLGSGQCGTDAVKSE